MKTIFGFQNVSVLPYIRGITIPELARWRPAQTHGALLEYRVYCLSYVLLRFGYGLSYMCVAVWQNVPLMYEIHK